MPSTTLKAKRLSSDGDAVADLGGQFERHELVEEEEEQERDDQICGHHPGGYARGLAVRTFLQSRAALAENLQGAHAQRHRLAERAQTAHHRVFEHRVFLGHARERQLFGDDAAGGFANRDAVAVRRAHHDAFHDGLAADKRFLAAFENGQKLGVHRKAQKTSNGQAWDSVHHYNANQCRAHASDCERSGFVCVG